MDDKELIGYCALHCQTERALFSIEHINRMLELAGRLPSRDYSGFYAVRENTMMQLVEAARKRMNSPELRVV